MPTQIDTPTGIGATTDWGLWGSAADKLAAVRTSDGDTSVIYAASGGVLVRQLYTFPTLAGIADPVTSASLSCSAFKYANGVGGQNFWAVWNAARAGVNLWSSLSSSGYVTCTYAATDLALATVNGQHGFEFSAAGGPANKAEVWISYLARTVDFTYNAGAAGEFAYLMGSLVGALIGANLLLRDMPGVARAMARVWRGGRSVRLRADELEPAWRAWRSFRSPVFGGV